MDDCHREARDLSAVASAKEEARRGDPSGLLRPPQTRAPRNDSPKATEHWHYGNANDTAPAEAIALAVTRASVAWLCAANLVGVLLASLLLWPDAGNWLAPLTYGRWMPLHTDFQLYGWCALPVAGVLLAAYLPRSRRGVLHARVALIAWSAALVASGADWLGGGASGKLFVEWSGAARFLFPAALSLLWVVLADGWWINRTRFSVAGRWFTGLVLAGLFLVPSILYLSSSATVFPAVNPHSGGATGTSLLGSSLGIIVIFLACPALLSRPVRAGANHRRAWPVWAWLAVSAIAFVLAGHGNASHHAAGQIAALAILLPWPLLVAAHWVRYEWTEGSSRWLVAALAWGFVLTVSGFLTFLPGTSERLKFTDALVAHAHLAMAGMLTSINVVLLLNLGGRRSAPRALGAPTLFWLWQAGCAIHVVVLSWLGWLEGANPSLLHEGGWIVDAGYHVRLFSGLLMTAAAVGWLWKLTLGRRAPQ
ncbi:MAG TPA: hypothetical protein VIK52_01045 [Opitutaceae bacterium]